MRICISGCPNNCAQSSVADIGLTGILRSNDGKPEENYRISFGGGRGRNAVIAKEMGIFSKNDAINASREACAKIIFPTEGSRGDKNQTRR